MRIIGGEKAGLTFESPGGNRTHPMSEKMRGALFNVLGDIKGLSALDVYAGSGALGFEALSRGAKHATFIDSDRNAAKIMYLNARKLGFEKNAKITQATVTSWLNTNSASFDLLFADPPYDRVPGSVIQLLFECLSEKGVLVLSWPGMLELPTLIGVRLLKNKAYGDSQLAFYKGSS